jgi:hypothetical protein
MPGTAVDAAFVRRGSTSRLVAVGGDPFENWLRAEREFAAR